MKQSEKLDLLLKGLYELKNKGKYYSLEYISQQQNIPIDSFMELHGLAHRLKDDNLINTIFSHNDISAELNTYGIEYCEEDSYSYKGNAIILNTYNIKIENSSDTTIVSQSENVKIETKNEEIKSELVEVINIIKFDNNITPDKQQILIDKINNSISKL